MSWILVYACVCKCAMISWYANNSVCAWVLWSCSLVVCEFDQVKTLALAFILVACIGIGQNETKILDAY